MNPTPKQHRSNNRDSELVKLALKNNRAAQKELFLKHAPTMMAVCRRYARDQFEAEDFLQEGFIRVFQYLYQYKNEGSLEGWIRRTLVNCILRHIQSRTKHLYQELSHSEYELQTDGDVLDVMENEELLQLIEQLPEGYKIIFNLYVIEGFTHQEISKKLHISPSTSRSQLVRAKNSLRKSIIRLNNYTSIYHGSF